jgi:hypothetical protein
LGAGVPAFVFGTGVLICATVPEAQPVTITSITAIKPNKNSFFFTLTSGFD